MARAKKDIIDEAIQSVYIDPLTDFGFKKIFLNKKLLITFLNDVVGTKNIMDVQYRPTETLGEFSENVLPYSICYVPPTRVSILIL